MLSYRVLPFKHLWLLFQFLQAWLINTASLASIHGRQFSWLGWTGSSEAQYTMNLLENSEPKCSVITAVTFLMVPARISSPLCTQSSLPIKGGKRKGRFHDGYAVLRSPHYSRAPGCQSRALEVGWWCVCMAAGSQCHQEVPVKWSTQRSQSLCVGGFRPVKFLLWSSEDRSSSLGNQIWMSCIIRTWWWDPAAEETTDLDHSPCSWVLIVLKGEMQVCSEKRSPTISPSCELCNL